MKKIWILLFVLLLNNITRGQEFSFPIYLEDALGYKDTLILGYDLNATDTIDLVFGENNIKSISFKSTFESRITDYDYTNLAEYIPDPTTFHTKRQIKKKDCSSNSFPLVSAINLSKVKYPLKVYWDSTLFTTACLQKSLIVDWHPGIWFDAVQGGEQGPFYLNQHDTIKFSHATHHYITNANDTIDFIFTTLGSMNNIISAGINNPMTNENLSVFPNPAISGLYIQFENTGTKIEQIKLFDLTGIEHQVKSTGNFVDLTSFPNGFYFILLRKNNGQIVMRKIIKTGFR